MLPYGQDITVIANGIDISAYPFKLRSTPEATLVWLRAFHKLYNPTLAVHAIGRIASEFRSLKLIMAGPDRGDGSVEAVRSESTKLGIAGQVEIRGTVNKGAVPSLLAEGDIFLSTSNVDNFPVSVLEAMASGACVVSTSVGGVPLLVKDQETGILVPRSNSEEMARAVTRLLTEKGLASKLSGAARNQAEQCDWRMVLPRRERLFESVAA
jgi:glycosyltransferase involved in cell wall biosynthesis